MTEPAFGAACLGKMPAHGDFVCEGLPPAFRGRWDGFLQRIVVASQAALGEAWRAAWLEAPLWHFVLGAGLAGAAPAAGVLLPSIDRVGRYFPFSIVACAAAGGAALPGWAMRAEALALAVLEDGFDGTRLRAGLLDLGLPAAGAGPAALPPAGWSAIDGDAAWPAAIPPFIEAVPDGEVLFWCRGGAPAVGAALRCRGLPGADDAGRLVAAVAS